MSDPFAKLEEPSVGLSEQAEREARREKARADRQKRMRQAGSAAMVTSIFTLQNLLVIVALPIVAAASVFDWYMAGRGWQDLLPNLGVFAWLGAAGSVGGWYIWVRLARERFRDGKRSEAWLASILAALAYVICVTGVILATATNAEHAQQAARESKRELAVLKADRDQLQSYLELQSEDDWQAAITSYTTSLKSLEAIAKSTYGMPNLDLEGACSGKFTEEGPIQKLNFNQIRSCVHANGGVDPHTGEAKQGLRLELFQAQEGLKRAEERRTELDGLEKQINEFQVIEGDVTAMALETMFAGAFDGSTVLQWVLVVISAFFLLVGGFLADWVLERFEAGRAALQKRREERAKAMGQQPGSV